MYASMHVCMHVRMYVRIDSTSIRNGPEIDQTDEASTLNQSEIDHAQSRTRSESM